MDPVRRSFTSCVLLLAAALAGAAPARTPPGTDWNTGDVFVGLGDSAAFTDPAIAAYLGTYRVLDRTGTVREDVRFRSRGITTGCAVDPAAGRLWATSFLKNVVEQMDDLHDARGVHRVLSTIDTDPHGTAAIESIVFDREGNFYVGAADEQTDLRSGRDGFGLLLKFSRGGQLLASYRVPVNTYPPGYEPGGVIPRGIDWFDIATGDVLFYTSEDRFIRPWNLRTGAPGPANPVSIQAENGPVTYLPTPGIFAAVPDEETRGVRLLPPGDGTAGGLLVATAAAVRRLDGQGREVAQYAVPATSGYFAASLSPDGQHVWTATTVRPALMKFHLATGRPVNISPVPIEVAVAEGERRLVFDRLTLPSTPYGLCVKLEYTAQTVDCAPNSANPVCRRVEACSTASPGDDDGDVQSDDVDGDCQAPAPVVEVPNQVSNAGMAVSFALPRKDAAGSLLTYSAVSLPEWLSLSPEGALSGTTPVVAAARDFDVRVRASDGVGAALVHFAWTVVPRANTPPSCAAAAVPAVLWPPNHAMVRVAVAGPAEEDNGTAVTITRIEQNEPTSGGGDGNTPVDGVIDGATALVRAERSGRRQSRVYRISFTASDASAASCSGHVFVVVPHDAAHAAVAPVGGAAWFDSTRRD